MSSNNVIEAGRQVRCWHAPRTPCHDGQGARCCIWPARFSSTAYRLSATVVLERAPGPCPRGPASNLPSRTVRTRGPSPRIVFMPMWAEGL